LERTFEGESLLDLLGFFWRKAVDAEHCLIVDALL